MALTAQGVTVRYGRHTVLDNVDFTLPAGATVGLSGPSGCGKSTLAAVMALLLAPAAGTIIVDGRTSPGFRYRAPRELRTRIGIVFQQPRLAVDPRLRLRDIVGAGLPARVGLTAELLDRYPHEVSDGQLQRACVARALATRPAYLICDEITTMLDAGTQAFLVHAIGEYQRETGAGVLAISHDPVLLDRWCDEVRLWPPGEGIRRYAGGLPPEVADALAEAYTDVFPGGADLRAFRARLDIDVERPGFRAVVAASADGIEGFATGWITQAPFRGDRAYQRVADQLGPERVQELLVGALEVDELGVRERARGGGLGRRLLDEIVRNAPGRRAWLLTGRANTGAVAFYRHAGWREVEPLRGTANDVVVFLSPATEGHPPRPE